MNKKRKFRVIDVVGVNGERLVGIQQTGGAIHLLSDEEAWQLMSQLQWLLYLDRSGNFDPPDIIAGVPVVRSGDRLVPR